MIALRHATLQGGLILGLIIFEQVSPPIARAGSVFFEFSDSINGTAPSSNPGGGSSPWLTANITDIKGSGGVQIKFTSNLQGNEFIDNVGFNLNDELFSEKRLAIDCISGACANFSSQYSKNDFSVVSGGASKGGKVSGFDIGFLFGNNQLKGRSMATIELLGADLKAAEFNSHLNTPANSNWIGGLEAAAKVKEIGDKGESGEIRGVDPPQQPIPGPLPILGVAAAFRTSRRLRRRLASARLAAGRPPAHRPA